MNLAGRARYARWAERETASGDERLEPQLLERPGLTWLPRHRAWPWIRGLYAAGVWIISMIVMSLTAIAAFGMTPFIRFKDSHDWCGAAGMARCLKLTGAELEVAYDPGFDPERRAVFCQNHISLLDAHVACSVIPHSFCGVMNHWHFRIPGYGWIMKLAYGIPVYPRAAGRTAEITAAARDRVEDGLSVLVFPEAHRTLDGQVRPFKRGMFFMARDAQIPVVPLAVRGLYEVNRKGSRTFAPGTIQVYVGPQIDVEDLDDEGVGRLAEKMTHFAAGWIREGCADTGVLR